MVREEEEEKREVRNLVLGKYEMGRVLGKGTFAKVYYGRDLRTNEGVAIKVINKDQVRRDGGMMDQIEREISVMRLVRHPNVVQLKEVMATKSRVFFVMEYVRGGELFDRVARGRLPEDQARRYFHQLISAVDFCHSRGVSHRDLKPENLLLDDAGDLKITDFGLSALPEQLRHDGLLHTQCGTPAYVAPEVLRKKGYDGAKADLWSCGVVLYVLLAGFLPFQHENVMKMYRKIFKAEYQIPPWVSGEARRLISRLLVVDPEKRISISEIKQLSWFKKGVSRPIPLSIPPPKKEEEAEPELDLQSPRSYNAFELISTMSSGFDLSSMFESGRRAAKVFAARSPAGKVVEKLEKVGRSLGFGVGKTKGCKVRLEGKTEGRKGRLAVTAEVFEVAPELTLVEFGKDAGDTLEFAKFCAEDVRPGLKDIVWAWQGDDEPTVADGGELCKS